MDEKPTDKRKATGLDSWREIERLAALIRATPVAPPCPWPVKERKK